MAFDRGLVANGNLCELIYMPSYDDLEIDLSMSKWPKHFLEARQLDLISLLVNFHVKLVQ